MKQISDEPLPPRMVEPSVPPELESVVMRALAKRPSERYRTAGEFSRALADARTALDGSGSTTRVMPAAGPPTDETRVMDPVTGPTRVAPPPPDEPPGERRRRWPWVVAAIVLLAALAVAGFLLFGGDDARAVTIPSVAGQSAAEAQATLENAGLEVEVQRVTNADVEAGQAIDTDPPEGSEVDEGDTVVLRVSDGPGLATVPDVEGDEEAAATAELQRADFEVDSRQEASGDVDEGVVISQSPAGGSQAEVGSTVTIVVSSGPETVSVPDVRQRSLDSAEATLNGAGLVVGNVTEEPSSSFAPGTVIRQDPGPTAQVAEGSAVDLVVVASTPEQVTVPSIVGNTATDAQTKLQNAGFDVDTVEVASDEPAGTVVSSDPPEGTEVEPGSTITISVSIGSSGSADPGSLGEGGGSGGDQGSGGGGGAQPPPPTP
jgi:serine/threonine-protein kinase